MGAFHSLAQKVKPAKSSKVLSIEQFLSKLKRQRQVKDGVIESELRHGVKFTIEKEWRFQLQLQFLLENEIKQFLL